MLTGTSVVCADSTVATSSSQGVSKSSSQRSRGSPGYSSARRATVGLGPPGGRAGSSHRIRLRAGPGPGRPGRLPVPWLPLASAAVARIEIRRQLDPREPQAVARIVEEADRRGRPRPARRARLARPGPGRARGLRRRDRLAAAATSTRSGYAQVAAGHGPRPQLGPRVRGGPPPPSPGQHHRRGAGHAPPPGSSPSEGGGHVHLWVNQPRPEHDRIAAAAGLVAGPDALPDAPPAARRGRGRRRGPGGRPPGRSAPARTRRPGWRSTTGRSPGTPSRAAGTWPTSPAREAEAWFDPAGFLLHEEDGRLVGFCWTKVHADAPSRRWARSTSSPSTRTPAGRGLGRPPDPRRPRPPGRRRPAGRDALRRRRQHRRRSSCTSTSASSSHHVDRAYTGDIVGSHRAP